MTSFESPGFRNAPAALVFALSLLACAIPQEASANLFQNGDFSGGNTGFATDYRFVAANGTVSTGPGDYSISTNPGTDFTNGYASFGDHTSGTGNMLFIDGSGSAVDIWRESVTLAANTLYTFSYYATLPYSGNPSGSDLPNLQFYFNGLDYGSPVVITSQMGNPWQLVTTSFTTGNAGSYTFAIKDLNTTGRNNDFAVDDFDLEGPVPEAASWATMILGLGLAGALSRRRARASRLARA